MIPLKLFQVAITYSCNKSCAYCYANNLKYEFDDMDMQMYKELLDWLENNHIKSFNFTGGEPTLHPLIKDFISLANQRGFKFTILSNGLFPSALIKEFSSAESFLINYNPRGHYTAEEYDLLHENLEALAKAKVKINLQVNITSDLAGFEHVLSLCRKIAVNAVNIDFIVPNALQSNSFVEAKSYDNKKAIVLDFVSNLKKLGIKNRISRPMPRCSFSFDDLDLLDTYFSCGTGCSIVTVNPDLTTFPCLSIFFRGRRITSFKDLQEFRGFYEDTINYMKWKVPLYEKCNNCIYFARKNCQGACLGYKCKPFLTLSSANSIIHSQYPAEQSRIFQKSVDSASTHLRQIFGSDKKVIVYLFDNREDLLRYSGRSDFPSWVNGFPVSRKVYFQYGLNDKDLVHELCHLFLPDSPDWLAEGFCEFASRPDNTEQLRKLLKSKKQIPFNDLSSPGSLLALDKDPIDKNICYQQSHSFVSYLVNSFGIETVKELLFAGRECFDQKFRELTRMLLSDCENQWLSKFDQKI
ncbi:MAG: radical SAM protein [Candidatus Woesearchaeota archaeon]